jgi:hypothetical protein
MEETQGIPVTEMLQQEEAFIFGGYHSIITGIDRQWEYGGFTLPDSTFWRYREPEAVVIVAGDHLRVSVQPITRSNDQVQMLDNPKNMFFSTRNFVMPDDGAISFAWEMRAQCTGTKPHDLYDGFVSAHLLDFSTGIAFDFFVCNDMIAAVYALHPYPGMPLPSDPQDTTKPKYFTHFNELAVETVPWQNHRYCISYHKARDEVSFFLDEQNVGTYKLVPCKINACILALGLMTSKSIEQGKSVSVHGQGLAGEWGPFTITMRKDRA